MAISDIEKYYRLWDDSIISLQQALDCTYLEAFVETGENILNNGVVQVENGQPSMKIVEQLKDLYQSIIETSLIADQKRETLQLIILNGQKKDQVSANLQVSPDAIGYYMALLADQLVDFAPEDQVLDIAVGTGNLLATVLLHIKEQESTISGIGVDNDETQLAVSATLFALLKLKVSVFHQDGLDPIQGQTAKLAIGDLPVGYYPIDERAKSFETHSENGHSYAHHLLIEQSMKSVVPDGVGFFLVPANIYETEQGPAFLKWITSTHYLQGFLTLPKQLFKQSAAQKAILIIQKHGEYASQVKEVLAGELPSLNQPEAVQSWIRNLQSWSADNNI